MAHQFCHEFWKCKFDTLCPVYSERLRALLVNKIWPLGQKVDRFCMSIGLNNSCLGCCQTYLPHTSCKPYLTAIGEDMYTLSVFVCNIPHNTSKLLSFVLSMWHNVLYWLDCWIGYKITTHQHFSPNALSDTLPPLYTPPPHDTN